MAVLRSICTLACSTWWLWAGASLAFAQARDPHTSQVGILKSVECAESFCPFVSPADSAPRIITLKGTQRVDYLLEQQGVLDFPTAGERSVGGGGPSPPLLLRDGDSSLLPPVPGLFVPTIIWAPPWYPGGNLTGMQRILGSLGGERVQADTGPMLTPASAAEEGHHRIDGPNENPGRSAVEPVVVSSDPPEIARAVSSTTAGPSDKLSPLVSSGNEIDTAKGTVGTDRAATLRQPILATEEEENARRPSAPPPSLPVAQTALSPVPAERERGTHPDRRDGPSRDDSFKNSLVHFISNLTNLIVGLTLFTVALFFLRRRHFGISVQTVSRPESSDQAVAVEDDSQPQPVPETETDPVADPSTNCDLGPTCAEETRPAVETAFRQAEEAMAGTSSGKTSAAASIWSSFRGLEESSGEPVAVEPGLWPQPVPEPEVNLAADISTWFDLNPTCAEETRPAVEAVFRQAEEAMASTFPVKIPTGAICGASSLTLVAVRPPRSPNSCHGLEDPFGHPASPAKSGEQRVERPEPEDGSALDAPLSALDCLVGKGAGRIDNRPADTAYQVMSDEDSNSSLNTEEVNIENGVVYVGMDLGTFKTSVASSTGVRDVVYSAVGWPKDHVAQTMLGRDVVFGKDIIEHRLALNIVRPFEKGVLKYNTHQGAGLPEGMARHKEAARLLVEHVVSLTRPPKGAPIYGVIGAPSRATALNKKVLLEAAASVFDAVMVVSEPFTIAYGMNRLSDTLVVDIGAGTVDLCPIYGTLPSEEDQITLPIGGDFIDEHFHNLVRATHPEAQLSLNMAREIKEKYGLVHDVNEKAIVTLPVEGKPKQFDLTVQLQEACKMIVAPIVQGLRELVARLDPELQQRMLANIVLGGGGSQLRGLDRLIEDGLKEYGAAKAKRVGDAVYAGAVGALKLAMSLPEEGWGRPKRQQQPEEPIRKAA